MSTTKQLAKRRAARTRTSLKRRITGRPRLSVFRSSKHIYAQVINDTEGNTVASASSLDVDLGGQDKGGGANTEAAGRVGALIAKRALDAGITDVVFDRGAYRFHGRIKALADAAREAGLSF